MPAPVCAWCLPRPGAGSLLAAGGAGASLLPVLATARLRQDLDTGLLRCSAFVPTPGSAVQAQGQWKGLQRASYQDQAREGAGPRWLPLVGWASWNGQDWGPWSPLSPTPPSRPPRMSPLGDVALLGRWPSSPSEAITPRPPPPRLAGNAAHTPGDCFSLVTHRPSGFMGFLTDLPPVDKARCLTAALAGLLGLTPAPGACGLLLGLFLVAGSPSSTGSKRQQGAARNCHSAPLLWEVLTRRFIYLFIGYPAACF